MSKQLKSMQNLSFEVLSAFSQHWRESPLVPDGESKKHLDFDHVSLVVVSLSFSPMLVLLCRARWCNPKLEQDPLASPAQKYWPWQEKNIWGGDHFFTWIVLRSSHLHEPMSKDMIHELEVWKWATVPGWHIWNSKYHCKVSVTKSSNFRMLTYQLGLRPTTT